VARKQTSAIASAIAPPVSTLRSLLRERLRHRNAVQLTLYLRGHPIRMLGKPRWIGIFGRLRGGGPVTELNLFSMLFALMLATFVGFQVIQNVSRLLHTPLMSLTNAISAIAVVGSIIIAGEQKTTLSTALGAVAVFASVTNIVSGFLITDRMLKMFKERQKP
jgi:NAD(P) transhydrogenase subunit alpha